MCFFILFHLEVLAPVYVTTCIRLGDVYLYMTMSTVEHCIGQLSVVGFVRHKSFSLHHMSVTSVFVLSLWSLKQS